MLLFFSNRWTAWKVLKDYCHHAILRAESTPMDTSAMTTFAKDGCSLTFLKADSTIQTGEYIKMHLPDFCGTNLVIAVIAKVITVSTTVNILKIRKSKVRKLAVILPRCALKNRFVG